MAEEALDSIKMGIVLIFFAAILSYVVLNTRFGKDMLNAAVFEIEEETARTDRQSFNRFSGEGAVVTAAAAYALIGYEENKIASVTCYMHGAEGVVGYGMDDTCLKNHLQGNVCLRAVCDGSGGYHLAVFSEAH